jgi:hypothetical protein
MADNPTRKFKFISPGVFIDEIDNSQIPDSPTEVGPLVIGRARKGPANKPVTVESFSDFVQTFGNPVPGGEATDVWREGNLTAPTYAAYAAQAWLRNNGPLSFMRVLGDQSTSATSAGKAGWKVPTPSADESGGGVFALVVWSSASISGPTSPLRGAVAAQIYVNSGRVLLSGSRFDTLSADPSAGGRNGCTLRLFDNQDSIKLIFTASSGIPHSESIVSLNPDKDNFIRKALNTNPTIVNSSITDASTRIYWQGGDSWVGESYEYSLNMSGSSSIGVMSQNLGTTPVLAALLPMGQTAAAITKYQSDFEGPAIRGSTGWFISQDLSDSFATYYAHNQQPLFRLEALTAGVSCQREVKISISNIKAPQGDYQSYGTFSVLVRSISDTDNRPQIIERWDNLTLNPASPDYIAARIGDKYEVYDQVNKRNVEYGEFDNRSNYVRVVMNETVAQGGGETRWLPFGVWGPPKYRDVAYAAGSHGFDGDLNAPEAQSRAGGASTMLFGTGSTQLGESGWYGTDGHNIINGLKGGADGGGPLVITNPSVPLRKGSTWGTPRTLKHTYWGAWSGRSATDTFFNPSVHDMLRPRNFDVQSTGENADPASRDYDVQGITTANSSSVAIVTSWVFSLDDVSGSAGDGFSYNTLNRRNGQSLSAASGSYTASLDAGLDRFTTFLHGGFDGYKITEAEPFNNTAMTATDEKTDYALFSLKKAINIASDPDYVQMNAVTIPGVWRPTVTNELLDVAEERSDALALIDIQYGYTPAAETTGDSESRNSGNTPKQAADTLADRSINNSYGATYYPWVRILDTNSNLNVWVPPSVAALGVLSTTDRLQAPWFAPAGFTRGGLSEGAAGLPVLDVSRRLTADDRDTLYERNINPIAKFPAEGIVVFGQKTLQQTASALDRINVRRLMIYLKREISFIASRLLFGPNNQDTWDRFLGQAGPLLESVKAEFGIDDFRLVLDSSTTTPDLIDRNIIYAKLLVKPTRAVEYFAIDFVVTNSGAAFED